jgi:hypothetical protein
VATREVVAETELALGVEVTALELKLLPSVAKALDVPRVILFTKQ